MPNNNKKNLVYFAGFYSDETDKMAVQKLIEKGGKYSEIMRKALKEGLQKLKKHTH